MLNAFYQYIQSEKRYSKHTVLAYKTDLEQFVIYLQAVYHTDKPEEANYQMIRSWLATLTNDKLSKTSINRKITTLRTFYKFLKRKGILQHNPMLKIKNLKKTRQIAAFIKVSSMEKIAEIQANEAKNNDFISLRNQLIIEILYHTGIRRMELVNLKKQDIDFNQKTIKVLGKGNKERIIPIGDNLLALINGYLAARIDNDIYPNSDYLFVSPRKPQIYPELVYNIVKKYLSIVATQQKKSPHVLRHSFATHMLDNGAEINAIKDILGHSSLNATQIYTHNTFEKLKKSYNLAHPRQKK